MIADGAKKLWSDIHGPDNTMSVGLQQDGVTSWLRSWERDGFGWRRAGLFDEPWRRLLSSSGHVSAYMMIMMTMHRCFLTIIYIATKCVPWSTLLPYNHLQAFLLFDLDGDGCIDHNDLRGTLVSLGEHVEEKHVQSMLSEVKKTTWYFRLYLRTAPGWNAGVFNFKFRVTFLSKENKI